MSETSHAAGRIAILTACTLFFAAAWRSDAPATSRPLTPLAWIKRGAGCAAGADRTGGIASGAAGAEGRSFAMAATFRVAGSLAAKAIIPSATEVATPFSGTPALLGRSTVKPIDEDDSRTAAAIAGEASLQ